MSRSRKIRTERGRGGLTGSLIVLPKTVLRPDRDTVVLKKKDAADRSIDGLTFDEQGGEKASSRNTPTSVIGLRGTLKDRKLHTIFDEVSTLISRNNVQTINFKLETFKWEDRGDVQVFEMMIQKFNERTKERKNAGEARSKVFLEPDPEQQGTAAAEVAPDPESNGDYW